MAYFAGNYGNLTYRMDLYTSEDYTTKVGKFPIVIVTGQLLYLEMSVKSGDPKVVLFPHECKATPSADLNAKPDHMIIEKGYVWAPWSIFVLFPGLSFGNESDLSLNIERKVIGSKE